MIHESQSLIMPDLDEMLQSLLLIEEGEHEFTAEGDVSELRHLFFPVTRHAIYLNHAATGPLPRPVALTMQEHITDLSEYGAINQARWDMHEQGAYRRLAALLHARPEQFAMTSNTSDGLMHIAHGLTWRAGDEIITAEGEFPSNVYPWLNLQEYGVRVHLVPAREQRIPTEDVLAHINEHTRLVSLSIVEFSTGYRNDIATIARACHERGVLCGVDGMQAVGALDIDVQALDIDFLASKGHKWLLGACTSGFLYVADSLREQLKPRRKGWFSVVEPFDFFNYAQPLKAGVAWLEYSAPNALAVVGLDAALGIFEALDGGMQAVEQRILGLTEYAINGLDRLGYPVISPRGAGERSGIVCFMPHPERPDLNVQQLVEQLAVRNVHIAARGSIARISPHFYNELADIDALLNALEDLRTPPVEKETK